MLNEENLMILQKLIEDGYQVLFHKIDEEYVVDVMQNYEIIYSGDGDNFNTAMEWAYRTISQKA
jgi:hypothetical protein